MLTLQQLQAVKAYIDATPELAAKPNIADGNSEIAQAMNQPASPAFIVWNEAASLDAVQEAVKWANLTPADAPDGSGTWANRSLACQGKQFNLQMILTRPSGFLRGDLTRVRDGLQDALTNVPSGASGAPVDAGWLGATGVRVALQRSATVAEKVLSSGNGTQGSPAAMTFIGRLSIDDVTMARNS